MMAFTTDPQRHPHSYTLSLLRMAIDTLPPGFSEERKAYYSYQYDRFSKDPRATYSEIRDMIVALGRESWAQRSAYHDMYSMYGRASEEANLIEMLDEGVRGKYEQFLHEGGKINHIEAAKSAEDLMNPSPFERYFTPEEKFAIGQALFAARDAAREEIRELLSGPKSDEYEKAVGRYRDKKKRLENQLEELRTLVGVSEKWGQELLNRLRTIEEGWSILERGLDEEDMEKEIEFWRGSLESFLHA